MPLRALGKLETDHLHHAVVLGSEGNMDALVDGKTSNLAEVMVAVRADGADAVGRERNAVRELAVNLKEFVFTKHFCQSLSFNS